MLQENLITQKNNVFFLKQEQKKNQRYFFKLFFRETERHFSRDPKKKIVNFVKEKEKRSANLENGRRKEGHNKRFGHRRKEGSKKKDIQKNRFCNEIFEFLWEKSPDAEMKKRRVTKKEGRKQK